MNQLYYGDNLDVLRRYVEDESVDLVYLDPPFKSDQNYNVLFQEQDGSRSAAQIQAFEDTWRWDQAAAAAYQDVVESGGQVSLAMQAFRQALGHNDMLAYLSMMAPRLVALRRALKSSGSLFLHCDPTASHYLKILLDAVFGPTNFRSEIIWKRTSSHSDAKRQFGDQTDTLLFFGKAPGTTFNVQFVPYNESYIKSHYSSVDEHGRRFTTRDLRSPHPRPNLTYDYKGYKPHSNGWSVSLKRMEELDVVLDPFCGCGTAIAAAQKLGRKWIGIDITHLAISLIKHRLKDAFGNVEYEVIGEPTDAAGAVQLAESDPYQFQWWTLGLVGARPVEQKKGADKGIDGRLYFHDEEVKGKTKQIVFSVKAGKTSVPHVRDLRGVVDREKAAIGVLLTLQKPTKPMVTEAASAGFYESPWGTKHAKLQLMTVAELLDGKQPDFPPTRDLRTFKKAPKAKRPTKGQKPLFGE